MAKNWYLISVRHPVLQLMQITWQREWVNTQSRWAECSVTVASLPTHISGATTITNSVSNAATGYF